MSGPRPMRIVVVGVGYVGLVSAACLAHLGHRVVAVDSDAARIAALAAGGMPFFEPGLQPLVAAGRASGALRFAAQLDEAALDAELLFLAVGTPCGNDGGADLRAVEAAFAGALRALRPPATLVLKSTVPVGTHERLRRRLAASDETRGIALVNNPEFLREGSAVRDFLLPDRIIVGADDDADAQALLAAYAPLTDAGATLLRMNPRSAELAKYAANGMLAARISFMNEMAQIADATGADIEEVRAGVGSDPRIGADFLRAGIGYGGSCFPKDVRSLIHQAGTHGLPAHMLRAVEATNEQQRALLFERIAAFYGGAPALAGKRIALWGLAFKPGTDDLREAPSLAVLERLLRAGAQVSAYDPVALPAAQRLLDAPGLRWCHTAAAALDGADALAIATEWGEFSAAEPAGVAAALHDAAVFDGRNCVPADAWRAAGLRVVQVGRPFAGEVPAGAPQRFRPNWNKSTMP
jgi:UDPglucose 6-dehydrogenase